MPTHRTPAHAWRELLAGNDRFVHGSMEHPAQDARHRSEVSTAQHPFAVVLGCSDSRVAAEIVFDRGLGDLFVVRTAGHVLDTTVLGSIEFGVSVLGAPLVLVLGHDSCGAVGATAHALRTGELPDGFVRAIVDRVLPSIVHLPEPGADDDPDRAVEPATLTTDPERLGREHVRHTVQMLLAYSAALREAVAAGRCAVVGAEYALAEGRVRPVVSRGLPEGATSDGSMGA